MTNIGNNASMMNDKLDPALDWLSDAQLSAEQRDAWNAMRAEVIATRLMLAEFDRRIKMLETQAEESPHAVLTRPDFNREVARMLAFNKRYGGTSSVIYISIENMESTATMFGKEVVEACLREATLVLQNNVRGSDILGRMAPDEFGILLIQCDNVNAWRKAEQIAGSLQQSLNIVGGHTLNLKAMFGAYTFDDKADNVDISEGLKAAAKAMTEDRLA